MLFKKYLEKKIIKQHKSYLIDKKIIDRFTFKYMIPSVILGSAIKNVDNLIKNMNRYGITEAERFIKEKKK